MIFAKRWFLTHCPVGEWKKVQSNQSRFGWAQKKSHVVLGKILMQIQLNTWGLKGLKDGGVVMNYGHIHLSTEIFFSFWYGTVNLAVPYLESTEKL